MNLKDLLRGSRGDLLPGASFNIDKTRMCMPTANGIACYRGTFDEHNEWHGLLVGIAEDDAASRGFLEGSYVKLLPPTS